MQRKTPTQLSDRLVQLHLGRSVHPIYREQMHSVPEGFRYAFDSPELSDDTTPTKRILEQRAWFASARRLAERAALRGLSSIGYVRTARAQAAPGAEIIHSCELLLRDAPLPYVLDFEHVELFVLYQRAALARPWARAWLMHALCDEQLRFLLPWSEVARESLYRSLGGDARVRLDARTRVIYPAVRPAVERPPQVTSGTLRVLFVGTAFYEKGAVEAIRAVQLLARTHAVRLALLSYAPPEWFLRLQDDPTVTIHTPGEPIS